jgi:hypothetical protein
VSGEDYMRLISAALPRLELQDQVEALPPAGQATAEMPATPSSQPGWRISR